MASHGDRSHPDPGRRSVGRALVRFVESISFKEIIQGLLLTLRHLFATPVTRQYPETTREPFPGSRALHALARDPETGRAKCVGCGLCAAMCPSGCIEIHTTEGDAHDKVVERYEVNAIKCLFCGLCTEACPYAAIVLTEHFAYAGYSREDFLFDKERLLENWDRHFGEDRAQRYFARCWKPALGDFLGEPEGNDG